MGSNSIERRPRKLIVACDGTWMNSDIGWQQDGIVDRILNRGHPQTPSNVTRICRAIEPEDPLGHPQIIYYQNGLGSSYSLTDHLLGGGLAMGLSENIRAAYGFLANNYLEKDLIYFVGFSRGAFTARSIAGMVAKFGLLKKSEMQYFYEVFEDFEGAGEKGYDPMLPKVLRKAGKKIIKDGKEQDFEFTVPSYPPGPYLDAYAAALVNLGMTRPVKVTAVGVFDTVGSLGLPVIPLLQKLGASPTLRKYRFYDTGIDKNILNAYQALALDEHRSAFSPTVWEKKDDSTTNLKQVWFPGVHCSVGGGDDDTGLSDITLAWMMSNLSTISTDKPELNITFNSTYLKDQVQANKTKYESEGKTWGWGLGHIENSFRFPTSLAGRITRSPDDYYKLNYATGKPDHPPQRLTNTNEFIHSSVRARMLNGGKTCDGKPYYTEALGTSQSTPLKAMEQKWVHEEGIHRYKWSFGNDKFLEEDELGVFEKEVLDEKEGKKLFGHKFKGSHAAMTKVSGP